MAVIRKQLVSDALAAKVSYGKGNTKKFITIHETDNTGKGANAAAHARLQANGNSREASWHWQVDDKEAVQSFDHSYRCWAAGSTKGNNESIHVEICVNSDGDYKKAVQNAAELVKEIIKNEKVSLDNVVQHNYWSGKNCPSVMRSGRSINWSQFKSMLTTIAKAEDKKGEVRMFKPSTPTLKNEMVKMLEDAYKKGIISSNEWAIKARDGELPLDDAIALFATIHNRTK